MNPQRLHRQQRTIFRTCPVMVAHPAELDAPGRYVRTWMAGLPVVVVAQPSGRPEALIGICGHQGAMLLEAPCGQITSLLCPRHGWGYELDGRASSSRPAAQSDASLTSVYLHEASGLLWGCLDGPIHADWLASTGSAVATPLGRCDRLVLRSEFGVAGPWEEVRVSVASVLTRWVMDVRSPLGQSRPPLRGEVAGQHVVWTSSDTATTHPRLLEVFPNTVIACRDDMTALVTCLPMAATYTSLQLRLLHVGTTAPSPEVGNVLVQRLKGVASAGATGGYDATLSARVLRDVMASND